VNKLAYRRAGLLSRAGLFQNGIRLKSHRGKYKANRDDGHTGLLELGRTWIDPVPVVYLDSQAIHLVRSFKWRELFGPCLLILLALFSGFHLAALLCLVLTPHLADSIRNDGSGPARYLVFGIKAGFILAVYIGLAWLTYPRIAS
jgi:hypothetical protein